MRMPQIFEPAPWFVAPADGNPAFHFDAVAGRYVVLSFFGSAADPAGKRVLDDAHAQRDAIEALDACFFGVSTDPDDERPERIPGAAGGRRVFWDFDQAVSRLYGAAREGAPYRPQTFVLDERLRILAILPIGDGAGHVAQVQALLARLPRIQAPAPAEPQAPVLVVPRVFEPELCRALMRHYDELGGRESGFMREHRGRTITVMDQVFKRRRDQTIEDESLRTACMHRIHDRLLPELHKAFQFSATRIERYVVACYDAASGGYFRPHRDNTTKGTAHRRFAVSLQLNTGEYRGGMLRFPEFGRQLYAAPAGGAVVFSCSLLHEATPVEQGRRFVFLPFLYDEAGAELRQRNAQFLDLDAA